MDPFFRFSHNLWYFHRSLPPISAGKLVMQVSFMTAWTILTALALPGPVAFVWAAICAQSMQLMWGLPAVARRNPDKMFIVFVVTAVHLGVMGIVSFWLEPWLVQRILSLFCMTYVVLMAMGGGGDTDIVDRFAAADDPEITFGMRAHLLKVSAILLLSVVAVNEWMIVVDLPLANRVAVLSVLPICGHYLYYVLLYLTFPSDH